MKIDELKTELEIFERVKSSKVQQELENSIIITGISIMREIENIKKIVRDIYDKLKLKSTKINAFI